MMIPGPVQTSYQQYQNIGQVGMRASSINFVSASRLVEDPLLAGIGFGLVVCQGTLSDLGVTLGQLSGGGFVGITMADPTLTNEPDISGQFTDAYSNGDNIGVMISGDIWVAPLDDVDAGGAVYYDSVTGQLGASGIANAVPIPNAVWLTSYPVNVPNLPATQIAIVRLGMMANAG